MLHTSSTTDDDVDECEGEEEEGCRVAKRRGGMYNGWEAYCSTSPGRFFGNGTCILLRQLQDNVTVASTSGADADISKLSKIFVSYLLYYFAFGLVSFMNL